MHKLFISLAYLIEENEALQFLVAQSNKLINTLVKGVRDKPSAIKGDDIAMEEDCDDDYEIIDEGEIKLYSQGCEVFHSLYSYTGRAAPIPDFTDTSSTKYCY